MQLASFFRVLDGEYAAQIVEMKSADVMQAVGNSKGFGNVAKMCRSLINMYGIAPSHASLSVAYPQKLLMLASLEQ